MSQDFNKYKTKGAYHYSMYNDPNWSWYKECIDKIVDFCKGDVIDVGCGDGFLCKLIKDRGYGYEGIDNDETGLNLAMDKNPDGFFTLVDVNVRYKASIGVDYIACLNTIEHLEDVHTLLNMVRAAKKGAIIVTDKATGHKGRYHEHEYTKEELLEVFKEFNPKYFEINSMEFGKPITFIGIEILK